MRENYGQKSHNVIASATYKSLKHIQKIPDEESKIFAINQIGQYNCFLCGATLNDIKSLEFHKEGKKHQFNLQQYLNANSKKIALSYVINNVFHPFQQNLNGICVKLLIPENSSFEFSFKTVAEEKFLIISLKSKEFHAEKIGIKLGRGELCDFFQGESEDVACVQVFIK